MLSENEVTARYGDSHNNIKYCFVLYSIHAHSVLIKTSLHDTCRVTDYSPKLKAGLHSDATKIEHNLSV